MRYFIWMFLVLFFSLNSYGFQSVDIVNPNYEIQNQHDVFPISNEELSELEMKIFNKTFQNEMGIYRLKRLEKEVMGMEQLGNIEERFELLSKVSEYYNKNDDSKISNQNGYNYYDNSDAKYYDADDNLKNKRTKFQNFLDDVKDTFMYSSMAGYTPPMNYYNNLGGTTGYLPNYYPYNNRFDNYRKNSGYYPHPPPPKPIMNRNNNYFYGQPMKNFNAGMGVRMID